MKSGSTTANFSESSAFAGYWEIVKKGVMIVIFVSLYYQMKEKSHKQFFVLFVGFNV